MKIRFGCEAFFYTHHHVREDAEELFGFLTQQDQRLFAQAYAEALVGYLAWAIPAIGFIGTVRGLAGAFGLAGSGEQDITAFTRQATDQLKIAFDCTLIALALSILLMYLLHTVQRAEETMVIEPSLMPGRLSSVFCTYA